MLPTEFWWFAIKRAAEVSNFLPVKANGITTTPFELVYHQKSDFRTLFPLFSVAYIRRLKDGDTARAKLHAKSLQCIAVASDNSSDGLLFYHPPSKQFLSSADYRLDPTL